MENQIRHKHGQSRDQVTLFPIMLDEHVKPSLPSAQLHPVCKAQATHRRHAVASHKAFCNATDLKQLAPMAKACARVLQGNPDIVADAGYASAEQLRELDEAGVMSYVAPSRAVNSQGDGLLFVWTDFIHDAHHDVLTCTAHKVPKRKQSSIHDKNVMYAANTQDSARCPKKSHCTNAKQRFVSRHQCEDALQTSVMRVELAPHMMRIKCCTVEHPFGTIKHQILGNARLLMRG